MADNRSSIYHQLSFNHDDIDELLKKIASGNVLSTSDYDKLVNIIGIDNISTFSGNYNDLQNTPNIPHYTSELENDAGFDKEDHVNQKLDAMYDRIVTLINDYENINEGIFANQSDLDKKLSYLNCELKKYVQQQINLIPLLSYATKTSVANKSDIGHGHSMGEINYLNQELTNKSNINHDHDEKYASLKSEHLHTNLDALNEIKISDIDYWTNSIMYLLEKVDKLDNDYKEMNNKLDEILAFIQSLKDNM